MERIVEDAVEIREPNFALRAKVENNCWNALLTAGQRTAGKQHTNAETNLIVQGERMSRKTICVARASRDEKKKIGSGGGQTPVESLDNNNVENYGKDPWCRTILREEGEDKRNFPKGTQGKHGSHPRAIN